MKYLFTLIISLAAMNSFSQTAGTLTFTVKTVTYSAPYSPKHILAIWVATSTPTWVKTRKFMSSNPAYRQYLTNFKTQTSSSYNSTDATTGATLTAHTTHTVTWDGKNASGTLVADGTYRMYIEFTSANAAGKVYYIEFTKGPTGVTLTPSNQTNFQNISLIWTPSSTDAEMTYSEAEMVECYPNPFTENLNITIKNPAARNATVDIYDLSGKKVTSLSSAGTNKITWDGKSSTGAALPSGIYFISKTEGISSKVVKVIKK